MTDIMSTTPQPWSQDAGAAAIMSVTMSLSSIKVLWLLLPTKAEPAGDDPTLYKK